ncbi:hypothetical protein BX600DRAFT_429776 [Xylariales sp. PMI_506]|nr:hypothetical protein BX600DRAFT_429776 [Xylariales sp. PMI_506]
MAYSRAGTTVVVLPGGCEFAVVGPSSPTHPYFPRGPTIRHEPESCRCADADGYMDDDKVFVAVWLGFWSLWNERRVLDPELRAHPTARLRARDAFSLPDVRRAHREWGLPSWWRPSASNGGKSDCWSGSGSGSGNESESEGWGVGAAHFLPSARTLDPIAAFWHALDGARDLGDCGQPDHAWRFVITDDLPCGPGWPGAGASSFPSRAPEGGPISPVCTPPPSATAAAAAAVARRRCGSRSSSRSSHQQQVSAPPVERVVNFSQPTCMQQRRHHLSEEGLGAWRSSPKAIIARETVADIARIMGQRNAVLYAEIHELLSAIR